MTREIYAVRSPALRKLEREIQDADSYARWLELAHQYDHESGADQWRQRDESRLYDSDSIRTRLRRLRRLRNSGDDHRLLFALNEGIHGNMAGMGKAKLYQRAKSGTKVLIEDYINEIRDALEYLSPRELESISWAERIEFFQRASHCYGRSALMLSGGGTLGYFHFGVLKALIEQKLCPVVISGASAGAFVAAIVGTRTDEEYLALFQDNYLARALTANRGNIKIGFGQGEKIDMRAIKKEMARMTTNLADCDFVDYLDKDDFLARIDGGQRIAADVAVVEPHRIAQRDDSLRGAGQLRPTGCVPFGAAAGP